ncbi:MAG TPA: hypothetical protein VL523_18875 [Terriglobia bacterium]|nr:hypothetical protein [Terriglobia bacterium]
MSARDSRLRPGVAAAAPRDRPVARAAVGRSPILLIFSISLAIAGVLAGAAWWMHVRATRPPPRPPLSGEARSYLPNIVASDARMSAAETGLGSTQTYLDARVRNQGAKTVRELDLQLEFVDMLNQVVLRHTAHPITASGPPLQPGESRPFRVIFDHMPSEWNQAPPSMTPVYAAF